MDFTETFHQEDTTTLTAEEWREAEQLLKDEQLRRTDPAAYDSLTRKRRVDQQHAVDTYLNMGRNNNFTETSLDFQLSRAAKPLLTAQRPYQNSSIYDMTSRVQGSSSLPVSVENVNEHPFPEELATSESRFEERPAFEQPPLGLPSVSPIPAANTRIQTCATLSPERLDNHIAEQLKANKYSPRSESSQVSAGFKAYPHLQNMLEREMARMMGKRD